MDTTTLERPRASDTAKVRIAHVADLDKLVIAGRLVGLCGRLLTGEVASPQDEDCIVCAELAESG
jgi:hypothetical protein